MPAMTGRIVSSAVTCGLLVSLCTCSPAQDVEALRLAAEQGDAEAQANLGVMYMFGRGVPQDDAEAVRWYRLAADQGEAHAQVNLGLMYAEGRGVPQDDAEALRWYRLAADQGNAPAQANLGIGMMYAAGEGVPQDRVAAHMWLSLAAARLSAAARDTIVEVRGAVAEQMTAEQVAEAQRLAREWKPTVEP